MFFAWASAFPMRKLNNAQSSAWSRSTAGSAECSPRSEKSLANPGPPSFSHFCAETALFYQALFNGGPNVGLPLALGLIAGLAALTVIFTLFYRYGVRIPMRPFFAVTSFLLYYMAFVFMGKGIRELQEADVMPITVVSGAPHIDAMGIYPSVETMTAQGILVLLLIFATVKTFWPGRKPEDGGAEA